MDKVFAFALSGLLLQAFADFEICNPGESKYVYQFMQENCPFGVLFDHPLSVNCFASTNSLKSFVSDVCNPNRTQINMKERPYQIQLATQMKNEPVGPDSSCYGIGEYRCDAEEFIQATIESMTPSQTKVCKAVEQEATNPEDVLQQDVAVFNQTERLFRYMFGLIGDGDSGTSTPPDYRVIKLLKHSFKIFRKFIPIEFIPREFSKDVEKAFLFLVQTSTLNNFIDTDLEDYLLINKTLTACQSRAAPFEIVGRFCKTCADAYGIAKQGKLTRYEPDEFAFEWGKYDVPVDATWNIIAFVHGLCYGTYKLHVNFHHLFATEMGRLFRPEILNRWSKPTVLYNEELWDHAFSANIRSAMKILDVSVFGAYHDTPFLHPLERPVFVETLNKTRKRRSASVSVMSMDNGGLQGAGWCFQTADEMITTVTSYMKYHCPGVPIPLEARVHSLRRIRQNEQLDLKPVQTDSEEFAHQ